MKIHSMFTARFGLVHDDCTCYRCWYIRLCTKCMICMLQVGVHCAGIICTIACYGIGTIISDCDCQHGMSYYCIYRLTLGVSDMDHFCWIWFFSFLLSSFQFAFLCMSAVHGEFDWRISSSLFARNFGTNLWLVLGTWNLYWDLNFLLGTWTGNLDLQLGLAYL